MTWTLANPLWLLILALALPMGLLAWRWNRQMSAARRISAIAARVLVLALLALMLADLSGERTARSVAVIGVVDVSESVRTFSRSSESLRGEPIERFAPSFLEAVIPQREPDDLVGLVAFDGRSATIATPTRGDPTGRSLDIGNVEGSDIAGALRHAAGLIPPDANGRIVLFTDGNATGEDPSEVARQLATRPGDPVRIDVVPIRYRVEREVALESLDAPPTADAEGEVTLRVRLRSTVPTTGRLRVTRNGLPMDINADQPGTDRRLSIGAGRHVEFVRLTLPEGRVHRFAAEFEPDLDQADRSVDTIARNNRAEAFSITPGQGRLLIVDGAGMARSDSPALDFAELIRGEDVAIDIVPPSAVPESLVELQAYDAIVLLNVPADEIARPTQELIAQHVKDVGAGLVMLGGPDSFGAGGWKGSPIEPLLPVKLELPDRLIEPEAAIVLVLDNSGSMAGSVMGSSRSQQAIANEAAAQAVETLDVKDLIGVIAFNSTADVVRELGPNTEPERLVAAIRGISSGGGTNVGPAMRLAREQLSRVDAKSKHVIVLSDGRSQGADTLPDLAAEMAADGIQVSTISVGDKADDATMEAIARTGGGAYYSVINPNVLPRVFLKAIRIVRSPMVREGRHGVVVLPTASPLVTDLPQPPDIAGLVLTQAKDEPGVVNALATDRGDPLLAHWIVELGGVVAFTSDTHRWTDSWNAWPAERGFWRRLVRSVLRQSEGTEGELEVVSSAGRVAIRYTALDDEGRPIDLLSVPVTLSEPDGQTQEITLRQVGPGEYKGVVEADLAGSYIALAKPRLGAQRFAPSVAGTTVDTGAEFRSLASDDAMIERIAQAGGGRVLGTIDPAEAELFTREGLAEKTSIRSFAGILLPWLLAVFLLDVGTRRIAWDRYTFGPLGESAQAGASVALSGLKSKLAAGVSSGPSVTLTDEDARELARQAKARRVADRGAPSVPAQGGSASPIPPRAPTPPREGSSPGMSDLLAAKKRARRNLEDGQV